MVEREFDPGWYLLAHGDVEESGMDPRVHFTQFGQSENRTGMPPIAGHPSEREFLGRWNFFLHAFAVLAHNRIPGAYVEFGTGRGSTLWCAHYAGRASVPRKIWSFDSFLGLPESASPVDDHPAWSAGTFSQPVDAVRSRLSRAGVDLGDVKFVQGFFSEVLRPERRGELPAEIALAYVDCDLYASTVEVLDYLGSVLRHGMIIAFDDYYCWSPTHLSGEQTALAEWTQVLRGYRLHPYLPIGWHGQSFFVEQLSTR